MQKDVHPPDRLCVAEPSRDREYLKRSIRPGAAHIAAAPAMRLGNGFPVHAFGELRQFYEQFHDQPNLIPQDEHGGDHGA